MAIPRVVIVGRPNVGKSSLLNMIAGDKISIVHDAAGTTRDRVSAVVDLQPPYKGQKVKTIELMDTGGFGAYVAEGERFNEIGVDLTRLSPEIEGQIAKAVSSADVLLFCVDAQAGITPLDWEIAKRLREHKLGDRRRSDGTEVPIQVVATKVDGPKWEAHAYELAALGFAEPWLCSAKSNYFRRDMIDALYDAVPDVSREDQAEAKADMVVAIIGKRNAGKSSLINAISGQERVIVSEIAGTTRDAVDVRVELNLSSKGQQGNSKRQASPGTEDVDGPDTPVDADPGRKSILFIDTAGLRRKKSFANQIEWWAFDRAKRSIDRADVVLLLIDATEDISQVDQQLAMLCQKAYKPVVIVVNKWDLVQGKVSQTGKPLTTDAYEDYLKKSLRGIDYAPLAFVSATRKTNLNAMVRLAFDIMDQSRGRVGTGVLNRLIRRILEKHNPPSKLGSFAKCYFVAQVATSPPTIVMIVNKPGLFTANYCRFLINRFREELPFGEVPIRLIIRERQQAVRDRTHAGASVPTAETAWEVEDEAQAQQIAAALAPEQAEGEFDAFEGLEPEADDDFVFGDVRTQEDVEKMFEDER
jgi:GTPase